jgi:hypothetical protein
VRAESEESSTDHTLQVPLFLMAASSVNPQIGSVEQGRAVKFAPPRR